MEILKSVQKHTNTPIYCYLDHAFKLMKKQIEAKPLKMCNQKRHQVLIFQSQDIMKTTLPNKIFLHANFKRKLKHE